MIIMRDSGSFGARSSLDLYNRRFSLLAFGLLTRADLLVSGVNDFNLQTCLYPFDDETNSIHTFVIYISYLDAKTQNSLIHGRPAMVMVKQPNA